MTPEVRQKISRLGKAHPNWQGGTYEHEGRVFVRVPPGERHLFPTIKSNGYVRRSHYVWNQHHPDDPVSRREIIHHLNEDKRDDRIENLEKMTQSRHAQLHFKGKSLSADTRATMAVAQQARRTKEREGGSKPIRWQVDRSRIIPGGMTECEGCDDFPVEATINQCARHVEQTGHVVVRVVEHITTYRPVETV